MFVRILIYHESASNVMRRNFGTNFEQIMLFIENNFNLSPHYVQYFGQIFEKKHLFRITFSFREEILYLIKIDHITYL